MQYLRATLVELTALQSDHFMRFFDSFNLWFILASLQKKKTASKGFKKIEANFEDTNWKWLSWKPSFDKTVQEQDICLAV